MTVITKSNETNLKAYCECIKEGLKTFFVPESAKMETVAQSNPEASSSKVEITSKQNKFKPKVVVNSESKTSKIQKDKTVVASKVSKPKVEKPKVMINQKLPKAHLKKKRNGE